MQINEEQINEILSKLSEGLSKENLMNTGNALFCQCTDKRRADKVSLVPPVIPADNLFLVKAHLRQGLVFPVSPYS